MGMGMGRIEMGEVGPLVCLHDLDSQRSSLSFSLLKAESRNGGLVQGFMNPTKAS